MKTHARQKRVTLGITLIEVSMFMVLGALIMAASLYFYNDVNQRRNAVTTVDRITRGLMIFFDRTVRQGINLKTSMTDISKIHAVSAWEESDWKGTQYVFSSAALTGVDTTIVSGQFSLVFSVNAMAACQVLLDATFPHVTTITYTPEGGAAMVITDGKTKRYALPKDIATACKNGKGRMYLTLTSGYT